MKKLLVLVLTAASVGLVPFVQQSADASNYFWQNRKPVTLKILQPRFSRWSTPTMTNSGWPITIEMTVNDELGLAGYTGDPPFPAFGDTGYVIFDDPDGCLTVFPPFIMSPGCSSPLPAPDETYLEFTPDIDYPGAEDLAGNDDLRMGQVDSAGGGPAIFNGLDSNAMPGVFDTGPFTGGEVLDGYGVGAPDDDIPGLVVLSPTGIGLVLDADFNPPAVKTLRNLAGLVSSVSYELSDWTRRTTITAHFNMPSSVVAPVVKIDNCVGDVATCADAPSLWRIDGGPVESTVSIGEVSKQLYPELYESLTYEMRFFVVSGTAPGTLADANGDGVVDSLDAETLGYTVLSKERSIKLKQLRGDVCFNFMDTVVFEDFDGNGEVGLPIVCPAGSGGFREIPR